MAQHREHHFVPRFHLRQFSADGRRINLFNFARMAVIPGVSIRGQCARRDFYRFAPGLEQAFSQLETQAAAVVQGVRSSRVAPEPETQQRRALLGFIVLQKARTIASGRRNDAQTDYLAKLWAQTHPELRNLDLEPYEIANEHPVALPLLQAPDTIELASDLELHLFTNDTALPFITSDDPVVLHNRYCEGIDYRGVLGWNCSGIQVFWPISPRELVLFYDKDVYRVGRLDRSNRSTALTAESEIQALNLLQILNAHQNVYWRPGWGDGSIELACRSAAERRPKGRTTFVETEEVPVPEGGSSAIVHMYERLLPIRLKLECVAIRRRARRVDLHRRATLYRKPLEPRDEDERFYSRAPLAGRYPVKGSFER